MLIRKILVPTDFSPSAKNALGYALELARPINATITLLHVWEMPVMFPPDAVVAMPGEDGRAFHDVLQARARVSMLDLLEELKSQGVNVEQRIESGSAHDRILQVAKDGGYDMIVMGTHGRSGLAHLLIGSITERVVRHALCPVLTVRDPTAKS